MAYVFILSLAYFFALGAASPLVQVDINVHASYTKQNVTTSNHWFVVQVEFLHGTTFAWQFGCVGSILNSRYVLSAASCFSGPDYALYYRRIRAGAIDLESGGIVTYIDKVNNYVNVNTSSQKYTPDVSVVRLNPRILFDFNIRPASIVQAGTEIPNYVLFDQAGWKNTSMSVKSVLTVDLKRCGVDVDQGHSFDSSSLLCGLNMGASSNANVGSPWSRDSVLGVVIVGVVSGISNNSTDGYILSSSIQYFTKWIIETAV